MRHCAGCSGKSQSLADYNPRPCPGIPGLDEIERLRPVEEAWHAATSRIEEFEQQLSTLKAAMKNALIGGNHLVEEIGIPLPAHTESHDAARKFYYANYPTQKWIRQYNIWCAWKAIMELRDALGDENGK